MGRVTPPSLRFPEAKSAGARHLSLAGRGVLKDRARRPPLRGTGRGCVSHMDGFSDGFSIIIPAHNEASVIQSTLRSILASKLDRPLQIIVVPNGCTDDTAARARAVRGPIQV